MGVITQVKKKKLFLSDNFTSLTDVSYWIFFILQSFTICIYCFLNLVCSLLKIFIEEEFDDTKATIRIHITKREQTTQWPKEKVPKDK